MDKGDSSDDLIPKFFRVYVPESNGDDLELPMFLNRFFSESFPENVTVRSRYGKKWRMGLRKCTEKFVLVNGWKKIARSENLISREFLFFEFDGSKVFSFCIYDRSMTKRLRSSTQTDEIEVEFEPDGEEERGSDDIISVGDDDDDDYVTTDNKDDDDDDDDIQDKSDIDKDKANDDDYVATDNEEHADNYTANDNADDHTINDDDYAANDDPNGDADDDQDGNDDAKRTRKVKDDRDYLDDRMNPFFTVNQKLKIRSGVRVPAKLIKDYNLKFHESIDIVDPLVKSFGKLKRKVVIENNGSVLLRGFESIRRRNEVKSSDKMICELRTKNGVVHEIKVHIVNV